MNINELLIEKREKAEEFLERKDIDGSVSVEENELLICWRDDFDRVIYNVLESDSRAEVGIMLLRDAPTGNIEQYREKFSYKHPDTLNDAWETCFEKANRYDESVLDPVQVFQSY